VHEDKEALPLVKVPFSLLLLVIENNCVRDPDLESAISSDQESMAISLSNSVTLEPTSRQRSACILTWGTVVLGMEDYIRGLLCGYLTVQTGARADTAKRRRMFVVLSDSRMDFYVTDPRPEFKAKIADAYIFMPGVTQVHYYAELHPRAPPHSLCLTTDKVAEVFIAESDQEATHWYDHLTERLEALASMVRGTLLLRKELSSDQQLKRIVFKTKYRWKPRYVELGRASLRFCKTSERRTKTMKQFNLTATTFVGEEGVEYLKRLRVFASYSIPVEPSARVSRQLERAKREAAETQPTTTKNSFGISIAGAVKSAGVSLYYPFIVATGETFLLLAAATERSREEWITAIRMRIISLKYRVNHTKETLNSVVLPKIQGFVDAMPKPGDSWKRRWVELENGILRVKASERRLGAIVETRLIPTCQVTPTLSKANAFVVSNLGQEIALAPSGLRESSNWMQTILESAKAVDHGQYRRAFDSDIQQLLRSSVVYTLIVRPGESVGLVLEKANKRVVVISHQIPDDSGPEATRSSFPRPSFLQRHKQRQPRSMNEEIFLPTDLPHQEGTDREETAAEEPQQNVEDFDCQLPIPPGSVLLGIQHFGMLYDSFENMWHKIRQKKIAGSGDGPSQQLKQPMSLLFRAPAEKEGIARVKYRAGDDWALARCRLANGVFRISCVHENHELLVVPLRFSLVELVSDENCPNCIKFSCTIPISNADSSNNTVLASSRSVTVFLKVELDADLFTWFEFLSLEIYVARDGPSFSLTVMTIKQAARMLTSRKRLETQLPSSAGYANDQQRAFRRCRVIGNRLRDVESDVFESEAALRESGEFEEFCGSCGIRNNKTASKPAATINNVDVFDEERRVTPTQSRIPIFREDREPPVALTDDEVRTFFQQIGTMNGGSVGVAQLAHTLARLTSHLRLPKAQNKLRTSVGNLLGSDFCSAVHALTLAEGSSDSLAVPFQVFESIVNRIHRPDVLELVRRFARGEIHIM
jgi:hypothetical protein